MLASVVIFIVAFCTLFMVYQKATNAVCKSKRRLEGKTCLVTGGTTGMGYHMAMELARRGARVIIACPFKEEGLSVEAEIKKKTSNNDVLFKHLDLASLQSTRQLAKEILETEERLDVLINNAGVGPIQKRTEDGLNITMQVNYYGVFLLTNLLLPLLKKSGDANEKSRIVNVASILHRLGRYQHGMMNECNLYENVQLYGNSKLCVLLFTFELHKKLNGSNVVVNCIDPGFVGTNIFSTSLGNLKGVAVSLFYCILFKTPWEGAQDAINAAVDERIEGVSGEYFSNCKSVKASRKAYDNILAKILWNKSINLTQFEDKSS